MMEYPESGNSTIPIYRRPQRIPQRLGILFRVDIKTGGRDVQNRLHEEVRVVRCPAISLVFCGVDLESREEPIALLRKIRDNRRQNLIRRGLDPTQTLAKIDLIDLGCDFRSAELSSEAIRGLFASEVESLKRLNVQPQYENMELLALRQLNVPLSATTPAWHWALFRYRAIYSVDYIDPHDRFLHLAVSIDEGNVSIVHYNYPTALPLEQAYSGFLFFLYEWKYSIQQVLNGGECVPIEGALDDPVWVAAEREIRTTRVPDTLLFDTDLAQQHDLDVESFFGHSPTSDDYVEPQDDVGAMIAAYFPDPRNPRRHLVLHELAHAIEHSLRAQMMLRPNVGESGSITEKLRRRKNTEDQATEGHSGE